MNEISIERADQYWAGNLRHATGRLSRGGHSRRAPPGELIGYHGVFILQRGPSTVVSCPANQVASICQSIAGVSPEELLSVERCCNILPDATKFIGPARVSYLDGGSQLNAPQAGLIAGPELLNELGVLRADCDETEWEWSRLGPTNEYMAGVRQEERIAAAAGYERWGQHLAHIGVITHPAFRGQGLGRTVVAGAAQHAICQGLTPQYRTLVANTPAIRLGESLGFAPYAESLAIRLPPST